MKDGVIVLDEGLFLPEGLVVDVVVPSTGPAPGSMGARLPHSVLDIPTVHVGAVLRPLTSDDDLLEEMLEGRP